MPAPDNEGLWLCLFDFSQVARYRGTADYVDKILKGAKAGELPIAQPTRFDMAINQKTAASLGITLPKSIVARANRVIE